MVVDDIVVAVVVLLWWSNYKGPINIKCCFPSHPKTHYQHYNITKHGCVYVCMYVCVHLMFMYLLKANLKGLHLNGLDCGSGHEKISVWISKYYRNYRYMCGTSGSCSSPYSFYSKTQTNADLWHAATLRKHQLATFKCLHVLVAVPPTVFLSVLLSNCRNRYLTLAVIVILLRLLMLLVFGCCLCGVCCYVYSIVTINRVKYHISLIDLARFGFLFFSFFVFSFTPFILLWFPPLCLSLFSTNIKHQHTKPFL